MPNRYFVRVVNAYSINEHYVVADGHRDSGCVNVYFNKRAAIEEAGRRNLDYDQGLLKGTQFELLGSSGLLESSCLLSEIEVIEEVTALNPAMDTPEPENSPSHSDDNGKVTAKRSKSHRERLKTETVNQVMRRKLVP